MRKTYLSKTSISKILAVFFILFSISIVSFPVSAQNNQQGSVIPDRHSEENIKRGERFFLGLLPKNNTEPSCVSCHNIKESDTLDWNPSAMAIAVKYAMKDTSEFLQVLKQPSGNKIEQVHKNITIDNADLKLVKLYLDNMAREGPPKEKPRVDQLLVFLFLGAIITLILLDLIFFKKMRPRFLFVIILLGALSGQAYIVSRDAIKLGRQQNYAPDQPIKFSHKVHVTDNKIACLYCHTTAERSKSAGIPAVSLCMNCHVLIREGTHSGKFEISKIVDASENGKPINWVRIHNLPDFVYFSHAIHVGAAKLDCAQCHGDIGKMDITRQVNDLSMGWCVNCHRNTKVANFSENSYYNSFAKLHDDLKAGRITSVTAQDVGANDCMKCHY